MGLEYKKREKRYEIVKLVRKHSDNGRNAKKMNEIVSELGLFSLMALPELSLGELDELHKYLLFNYEKEGNVPPPCA